MESLWPYRKKTVPIGISDFKSATTEYYYVDKTLLLRDFIDNRPKVALFTRPRRFGKTLNMDMLRVYFEKTEEDTSIYFKDKFIWQCGPEYTDYQGKYPVIFLTFKDVTCSSWKETYEKIRKLISLEFLRHFELADSDKLNTYEKEQYRKLAEEKASEVEYQMSLQLLSLLLTKHYDKEAIIIIHRLLRGQSITSYIDTSVIYPEVQNSPHSIYSFLLIAGYLKVSRIYPQNDGNFMCDVSIPNKEIAYVYEKEVLAKTNQSGVSVSIQRAIFTGDEKRLQALLEEFMIRSVAFLDGSNESFYHGMMLGLCAVLSNRYHVRSDRKSGYGRFDIQLIPQIKNVPGFIFEFKHTRDEKENLEVLANEALEQIERQKYDTELSAFGVDHIIKIGIAFCGKRAVVKRN